MSDIDTMSDNMSIKTKYCNGQVTCEELHTLKRFVGKPHISLQSSVPHSTKKWLIDKYISEWHGMVTKRLNDPTVDNMKLVYRYDSDAAAVLVLTKLTFSDGVVFPYPVDIFLEQVVDNLELDETDLISIIRRQTTAIQYLLKQVSDLNRTVYSV